MRKKAVLLSVLATVFVLLIVIDLGARSWAESKLSSRIAGYYELGGIPPPGHSSASIHSFPFIGRLLLFGRVPGVSVSVEDLQADTVLVKRLTLDLDDVDIDRGQLFRGKVKLTDVGEGRVEALIDGASISRALGADIRFAEGEVEVHRQVGGAEVVAKAKASIKNNVLRLEPTAVRGAKFPLGDFALSYEIPGAELLPCTADGRATAEGLLVSCTIADIPPSLVRAAQ